MAKGNNLNEKQKKFCEEYVVDGNGAQAAIRAGYSEKTARAIATENLTKLAIQRYIHELRKSQQKRLKVTADDVLRSILLLAEHDVGDAVDSTGALLRLHEMPKSVRLAIKSFEVDDDGYLKKVTFYDKMKANELLGKHFKLFTDVTEHKLEGSLAALVQASIDSKAKEQEAIDVTPAIEGEVIDE